MCTLQRIIIFGCILLMTIIQQDMSMHVFDGLTVLIILKTHLLDILDRIRGIGFFIKEKEKN